VLMCPLFVEAFSVADGWPDQRRFYDALGRRRSLILYDTRGTGLSDREVDDLSAGSLVLDLAAVVEAAGFEKCSVFAAEEAGPRAIRYAVENPDRVESLVLWGTFARGSDQATPEQIAAYALMCRQNWRLAAQMSANISGWDEEGGPAAIARTQMYYRSTSGEMAARMVEATHSDDADVTSLLPKVKARTLVLHRSRDRIYPFRNGQAIAQSIPGARLVVLSGVYSSPVDPPTGLEEIDQFLRGDEGPPTARDTEPIALTRREIEVLGLIAAGKTSGEVSRELSLSIRTVGRHITNIYTKIGAKGRAEAAAYALRHGIVDR